MSKEATGGRIAIFLPDLNHGGEQRILVNFANKFSQRGIVVDFLLVKGGGALQPLLSKEVNIFVFETRNTLSLFKLITYLRRYRPATLLSSLELTNVIALTAVRFSRVKCKTVIRVAVALSMHRQRKWIQVVERATLRLIYPWADTIVTVSDGVKADLIRYAGLKNSRSITTIYNPVVSSKMFALSEEPITHKWLESPISTPFILGIGRLSRQKDFPCLIRAISIVNKRVPIHLIIIGDGEERKDLEQLIKQLELEDVVDLPGFIHNPYPYFKQANAFVLSSRWEGLPSVLIEALSLGCPTISTNCPYGADEILGYGKYGTLVPVGDDEKMASAIIDTLNDADHHRAPKSWINQFSMKAALFQTLELITSVDTN